LAADLREIKRMYAAAGLDITAIDD